MVNESIDDHDKEEESPNDTIMEGSINLASNKPEVSMDKNSSHDTSYIM